MGLFLWKEKASFVVSTRRMWCCDCFCFSDLLSVILGTIMTQRIMWRIRGVFRSVFSAECQVNRIDCFENPTAKVTDLIFETSLYLSRRKFVEKWSSSLDQSWKTVKVKHHKLLTMWDDFEERKYYPGIYIDTKNHCWDTRDTRGSYSPRKLLCRKAYYRFNIYAYVNWE